ncbi:MAG TPA: hypothetical protein EYP85_01850 [Armatimonadetes bacterium]|nr:hypothetical protein [Armatimonadota bacterium]
MQNNSITISLALPEFIGERVEETEHHLENGWAKPNRLPYVRGHPTDALPDERVDDVWPAPFGTKGVRRW